MVSKGYIAKSVVCKYKTGIPKDGGVLVNPFDETSIDGLFACGKVACTGLHDANLDYPERDDVNWIKDTVIKKDWGEWRAES